MRYVNDEDAPEKQISPEEYLAEQKKRIRTRAFWGIGIGAFVVVAHLGWVVVFSAVGVKTNYSVLFQSIFFILGLFILAAGVWGWYYAKNLKLEDLIPSPERLSSLGSRNFPCLISLIS